MKIIIYALLLTLLLPLSSTGTLFYLKLRANHHPEFLRIVLEGEESIISGGMVNQKGNDIVVRFPYANIILQERKIPITYNIDKGTITFHPGPFNNFKVFSLKYPSRLVVDVYLETRRKHVKRSIEALRQRWRNKIKSSITSRQPRKIFQKQETKIFVIDPGHGGYESGIVSENYKEKSVVLDISKRLNALISRGANKSFLTRESDQFMTLRERSLFANRKKADIFLSLHVGNHREIVLYTPVITETVPAGMKGFLVNKGQEGYMEKTAALRDAFIQALTNNFGNDMVTSRPLPYSILAEIEGAALIIELPSFTDILYKSDQKTELANSIYKGLYLYEENTTN
jgi:hypothetical protein